jgi:hypothetical protein
LSPVFSTFSNGRTAVERPNREPYAKIEDDEIVRSQDLILAEKSPVLNFAARRSTDNLNL